MFLVGLVAPLGATGPHASKILHEPPACIVTGSFPKLRARIEPVMPSASLSIRFRQEGTLYWYVISMAPDGVGPVATLPRPRRTLRRIEYFFETQEPGVAPSPAFVVDVTDAAACSNGREGAEWTGRGSVTVGHAPSAPPVPPGFQDVGLTSVDEPALVTPETPAPAPSPTHSAATATPLRAGERVRITTTGMSPLGGRRLVGSVQTSGPDGVVLLPDQDRDPINLPPSAVARVEVSLGHKDQTHGALVGGLVALAAGTLVGYIVDEQNVLGKGLLTGLVAFPVGAAVGFGVSGGERWVPASLEVPRARGPSPPDRAVEVAFSIRF